jgi:hypothetical protein
MLTAVMNRNGQADHVGQDHGAPRPGLDRLAAIGTDGFIHLLHQVVVDEWAFFD